MKAILAKFLFLIKSLVKPLGFVEYSSSYSTLREFWDIQRSVYDALKVSNSSEYDEIFKRYMQINLVDIEVLKNAKSKNVNWLLASIFLDFLRRVYYLFDVFSIFLVPSKVYHLNLFEIGDPSSARKIFSYSNNKSRDKIFLKADQYHRFDAFISNSPFKEYQVAKTEFVTFRVRYQAFLLKKRYPFIPSKVLIEVLISKILFAWLFSTFCHKSNLSGAILREGTSANSRAFLHCAGKAGIKRSVIYTIPVLSPIALVPRECENLVIVSDVSKFHKHPLNKVNILKDYPFLDWRILSSSEPKEKEIGLLFGDGENRWSKQKLIDKRILDQLKSIDCKCCYGRPHPQELNIKYKVEYYNQLAMEYPFLKLHLSSSHDFFSKIGVLIAYSQSTMVQEALLCKKYVVEIAQEKDYSPNYSILSISNQLSKSIYDIDNLEHAFSHFFGMSATDRDNAWYEFLDCLGIDKDCQFDEHQVFESFFFEG